MTAARAMRRFTVTVAGYGEAKVHAITRGQALADSWRCDAFGHLSFRQFLGIANARLDRTALDSDGYAFLRQQYPGSIIPAPGTRITAEGLTGTVLAALEPTSYVTFQPDGQERRAHVHPMSVQLEAKP